MPGIQADYFGKILFFILRADPSFHAPCSKEFAIRLDRLNKLSIMAMISKAVRSVKRGGKNCFGRIMVSLDQQPINV